MSIVPVYDAIHANVDKLPSGQRAAGYTTGGSIIKWADADWKSHPGAVRICQDSQASDETADALDVEAFAATNQEAAAWYRRALSSYASGKRPGQRHPAIYTSASNVTALVNALNAGGVKSGPGLWVAHWGEADATARAEVRNAAGPFPIVGVQNHSFNSDDESWMSESWLNDVSKPAQAGPHEHTADGKSSMDQIARTRNMKPDTWLALQRRLGADVGALAAGPVPAGAKWYSIGP